MSNEFVPPAEMAQRYVSGLESADQTSLPKLLPLIEKDLKEYGGSRKEVLEELSSQLSKSGVLPGILVDFSQSNFSKLSRGDDRITSNDLDRNIQDYTRNGQAVSGLLAKLVKDNRGEIEDSRPEFVVGKRDGVAHGIKSGISKEQLASFEEQESVRMNFSQKQSMAFRPSEVSNMTGGGTALSKEDVADYVKSNKETLPTEYRDVLAVTYSDFSNLTKKGELESNSFAQDAITTSLPQKLEADLQTTHKVKANDSLYDIAKNSLMRAGSMNGNEPRDVEQKMVREKMAEIRELNGVKSNFDLKRGQELKLFSDQDVSRMVNNQLNKRFDNNPLNASVKAKSGEVVSAIRPEILATIENYATTDEVKAAREKLASRGISPNQSGKLIGQLINDKAITLDEAQIIFNRQMEITKAFGFRTN